MSIHPQADEFAKIVVEEGVPVVTTGAGKASAWVDGKCAATAELTFVLTEAADNR